MTKHNSKYQPVKQGMFAPNVRGVNSDKLALFRMDQRKAKGNPERYPLGRMPFGWIVSFGEIYSPKPSESGYLRLNNNESITRSGNKLTTNKIWREHHIPASPLDFHIWSQAITQLGDGKRTINRTLIEENVPFPMVAKLSNSSGGKGFRLISNVSELTTFLQETKTEQQWKSYFLEPYFQTTHEFRIHVAPALVGTAVSYSIAIARAIDDNWVVEHPMPKINKDGVVLIQRKIMTQEAKDAGRVHRSFEEGKVYFATNYTIPPECADLFTTIRTNAVEAIRVLGLDFGFVDCGVNFNTGEYTFFESGCNPGMKPHTNGNPTINLVAQHYMKMLPNLALAKATTLGLYRADKVAEALNKQMVVPDAAVNVPKLPTTIEVSFR